MISTTTLLLTAGVVILLCGSKRLRHLGEDIGIAIKGLRKGLQSDESATDTTKPLNPDDHPKG